MTLVKELRKCPYCRETIAADATRCKHCHAELPGKKKTDHWWTGLNTFRTGFLTGVLFTLILALLVYFHFSGNN